MIKKLNFIPFYLVRLSLIYAILFGLIAADPQFVRGQRSIAVYKELQGKQKKLFDDWAALQNSQNGQNVSPLERFRALSVSQGATYQAITNALAKVKIKGKSRPSDGTAIDLISAIENIAGEEEGKGGDEQFRIYVKLADRSIERLDIADAFHRGKRNFVFHRDYPNNFRQTGGSPSIQFSISGDGSRADIDIDYHSSSFPAALFNGHLKASNSDVRPHGNYRGYVRRWKGLRDWWDLIPEGLNSLVEFFGVSKRDDHIPATGHPHAPDAGTAAAAANKFFKKWIAEKDSRSALEYVSPKVDACVHSEKEARLKKLSAAASRDLLRKMLVESTSRLGEHTTLSSAIYPVDLHDQEIKLIDHEYREAFTFASITQAHYDHFVCGNDSNTGSNANVLSRERYGDHYLSVFAFKNSSGMAGGLIFLWTREPDGWKIRSFDSLSH